MKKRILSLALVVALVMVAVAGATMAYFTDTEQAVNIATIGNVSIKQHELQRVDGINYNNNGEICDGDELEVFEQGQALYPAYPENGGASYTAKQDNADQFWWGDYVTADVSGNGSSNGLWGDDLHGAMDKFVFVENDGASACYYRTWIALECPEGMEFSEGSDKDFMVNINGNNRFTWSEYGHAVIDGTRYLIMCATYNIPLESGTISRPSLLQVVMTHHVTNEKAALLNGTYEILVFSQAVQVENFPDAETALTEAFGNDIPWTADFKASEVFHVSTSKEMEAAMDSTAATVIINLEGDVSYDVTAWSNNSIGGANTQIVQIEGNGHTLTFNQLNSDWNNVIMTNEEGTLILKDLRLTNSGKNTGPWNRHDVNFACDVVMENVTTDKAVAVKAGAKLTNVKITDTGDVYGLWIQANGQTVDLENVTIATGNKASMVATAAATESGRGIKIADEYVDAPASVTLNVNNSAFFTGKKAAVLVTSTAGADITFINSNILGCSADPINPVWVDEDRTDYASQVTVNGGNAVVEGSTDIIEDVAIIGDGTSLKAALNGSEYVILSGDVNSTASEGGYNMSGANVSAGKVLDGNGNTLNVSNANSTWDCAVYTNGGTIKNLTINGAFRGIFTAGCSADIVIDNVIIDDVCYTISSDGSNRNYSIIVTNSTLNGWTSYTSGYKSVSFTNCRFGQGTGSYRYAYCRPYSNTTFTGCVFEVGYEFDATQCTSTFVNCYVGDTLITADNVVSLLGEDAAKVVVSNG